MEGGAITGGQITGNGPVSPVVASLLGARVTQAVGGPVPPSPPRGIPIDQLGRKRLPRPPQYHTSPITPGVRDGRVLPSEPGDDEQRNGATQPPVSPPPQEPRLPFDIISPQIDQWFLDLIHGVQDTPAPGPAITSVEEGIAKKIIGDVAVRPVKVVNWLLGGSRLDPASNMEGPITAEDVQRLLPPSQRTDPLVIARLHLLGAHLLGGVITGAARPATPLVGGSDLRYAQSIAALQQAGALGQLLATIVFPGWMADP